MGFTLSLPDKQYRLDSLAAQGPQVPDDPTTFEGSGAAVGTGIVSGLAAVARTASNAFSGLSKVAAVQEAAEADPTSGEAEKVFAAPAIAPPLDDQIQAVQDWSKPDPTTQGSGARMLGGAARSLTIMSAGSLFGGPVGSVGTLAGVEGYNTYRDVQRGPNPVDPTTALKMGAVSAVASGLGAVLPLGLGKGAATGLAGLGMSAEVAGNELLSSSLFGAAHAAAAIATNPLAKLGTAALINTGFGAANRYATSSILEDAGYKDMAAQYAPMDSESLAADFVMGLAFGAHAEIAPHVEPFADRVLNGPAPPIDARPPASMVEAALGSRRQDMLARNGAGIPIDPAHANLDSNLQDGALSDLLRGREVSISPDDARTIVGGVVPDPARQAINDEYLQAMQAHYGMLADFDELPHAPERTQSTSDILTGAQEAPGAAEGLGSQLRDTQSTPHLSDFANESLSQLVGAHPDLPINLGDGNTVRMADLPAMMATDAKRANDEAKLYDVALACAART